MSPAPASPVNPGRSLRWLWLFCTIVGVCTGSSGLLGYGQQLTGTISGVAYDQSGAAVPNAAVFLKNSGSGDQRTSRTDKAGAFSITGVPAATYSLSITADGFTSWQENDIVMGLGDNRAVPNIRLQVGGSSEQINVIAGEDVILPTDTAEISTSLNQEFINDFPLQGRNAGELLKVFPGMGLNPSGGQGGFSDKAIGSNNGPVGTYSANGTQPTGAIAFLLDGANLVDPGNFGTQIANINPDMISNVKLLTSDYGAEYAKGPVIFEAFSRSGTKNFHGEAYLYTHNSHLNSVDAYTKSQGGTNANESYYYIGGNVGGPVILPFLPFNRQRNKLFFWAGYEYMKQQPAGSILNFNVPNPSQLTGDFSNNGVDPKAITAWPGFYAPLGQNVPAGGSATGLPTSTYDPNILGILKLYPTANETPSASNGYNDYRYANTSPQNRWEATGKVDYDISDNDKIAASYGLQKENDLAPISIWWAQPWTLPYPTPAASVTTTNIILTNYTHVFSPTTTNEAVFVSSHFVNPYKLADPSVVSRSANQFNVQGLFNHTTDQIPNFEGPYPGTLANLSNYTFTPGYFGGTKQAPAFYDNFTKVLGAHTLKFGVYWDMSENKQTSATPDNGTYNFGGSNVSTNNYVADLELGNIASYQQQNYAALTDTKNHQYSFYGQDSWKLKRLTMNYGLRFDHVGQFYGIPGGFQVWNPATLVNAINAPDNSGLLWHGVDASLPDSGFNSPLFYWAPRLGAAYDLFGNGHTILRGGFATYRYTTGTTANAAAAALSTFSYTTPTAFKGYANITGFTPPSATAQNGSAIYALLRGDDRGPYTNDWNFTVSQALKWRSILEVSWVGNRTADEVADGPNANINKVAPGAIFGPDPVTNQTYSAAQPGCPATGDRSIYCDINPIAYGTSYNANDYRQIRTYTDIFLTQHLSYANYNSLQTSLQKQTGPVTLVANWTYSKVLGIRDGESDNGPGNGINVDPFNLQNNYGPLAFDHTHIVNLSYTWKTPKPFHGDGLVHRLEEGLVNGWEISGYTAFQSGSPLQPQLNGNFNSTFANGLTTPTVQHPNLPDYSVVQPNGLHATSINGQSWFGTSALTLLPALSCDPTQHLAKGQRFNPACFMTPAYGTQGPNIMPYMRAPNYWDSDLGIFKSFSVREGQRVEFRVNATNWLNHPLRQFGLAGAADESLNFTQQANATCAGCVNVNLTTGAQTPIVVTSLSPTNTNAATTGTPAFKTGSRFVTVAAKYYF